MTPLQGRVGDHAMIPLRWKVKTDDANPNFESSSTECGDPYLQWVQPMSFLTFACARSGAVAPGREAAVGVPVLDDDGSGSGDSDSCAVGMPWVCNMTAADTPAGQLPAAQADTAFKY
jgi:hypothetical protein